MLEGFALAIVVLYLTRSFLVAHIRLAKDIDEDDDVARSNKTAIWACAAVTLLLLQAIVAASLYVLVF